MRYFSELNLKGEKRFKPFRSHIGTAFLQSGKVQEKHLNNERKIFFSAQYYINRKQVTNTILLP